MCDLKFIYRTVNEQAAGKDSLRWMGNGVNPILLSLNPGIVTGKE